MCTILEACSWRADSTRCYPGYCANGLAANCTCVAGFTGKHCEISKSLFILMISNTRFNETFLFKFDK